MLAAGPSMITEMGRTWYCRLPRGSMVTSSAVIDTRFRPAAEAVSDTMDIRVSVAG